MRVEFHELDRDASALLWSDVLPSASSGRPTDSVLQEIPNGAATIQDLIEMFTEDPVTKDQGHMVSSKILTLAVTVIDKFLHARESAVGVVGNSLCQPFFLFDGSRARFLQHMAQHLLRRPQEQGDLQPPSYYVSNLIGKFSMLLLHYKAMPNYWVVFEIVWRSDHGRYLKLWDGVGAWTNRRATTEIPEVHTIITTFFEGDDGVPVHLTAKSDPSYGSHASGPFSIMTMSSLALGVRPQGWTASDEAVARNYTWGCLMQGRLLDLPRRKLGV